MGGSGCGFDTTGLREIYRRADYAYAKVPTADNNPEIGRYGNQDTCIPLFTVQVSLLSAAKLSEKPRTLSVFRLIASAYQKNTITMIPVSSNKISPIYEFYLNFTQLFHLPGNR